MHFKMIFLVGVIFHSVKLCMNGDPFCSRCSGNVCTKCYLSYSNEEGKCSTESLMPVSNCETYETNSTCKTCVLGYKVNINGQCIKITLSNCMREDFLGNCIVCDRNYVPVEGVCKKQECTGINNCILCESLANQNTCHLCDENMVLHTYNEKATFK